MAVFSKLISSIKKHEKTKKPQTTSQSCKVGSFKLNGLKIKGKLLLPLVVIPDSQPAMALFRAGGCEKRKGKSVATLNFSKKWMYLTTKNQEQSVKNCTTIIKFTYKNIVSVDITERKNEVAIVCKRPVASNSYWCVCLKLKTAKGFQNGKISKSRKVTGKEVQQLLQPQLKKTNSRLPPAVCAPPKDEPLVRRSSVSELHVSEPKQEDTTSYNGATVSSDEVEPIASQELGETKLEQHNQEFDTLEVSDAEQESASQELHESVEEENSWEISDPVSIHEYASCPNIYMEPCEVDGGPTEDECGPSKRHLSPEVTLANALQLSDEAYYDRNRNRSHTGYFHFQQTQQTAQQASSFSYVQSATPGYNYTARYSSTPMNYYYNGYGYLTYQWQLQYTVCPPTPESSSSTELDFGLYHSPAFCIVSEQYETSPHILC